MDLDLIYKTKEQFNCDYIDGLYIDIIASIERDRENIINYSLDYNEVKKCYNLKFIIDDFSIPTARKIFFRIIHFISYSNAMFVRKVFSDVIAYYLLSTSSNSDTAFFVSIAFACKNSQKKIIVSPKQLSLQQTLHDSDFTRRQME